MADALPSNLIPGAEPMSHVGGRAGALVLHGFTGNPGSMRGIADALVGAGFGVEMPLLPGHGTVVADMLDTGFADWLGAAEDAYQAIAARSDRVVIVGLSMGGALTAWLGGDHPEVAGLVCINAIVSEPEGMRGFIEELLASGTEFIPGIGSDIAKEGVEESAYLDTPVRPLLSLVDAAAELDERLARITCPVLVVNSPEDHVVPPENSDVLAARVAGPVERLSASRSYHVATIDHDKELIEEAVVAFALKVTAG
ncbi:MAG: alpha/beta fold hydrolase [Actinobacteria bacterium]|nr:alpha/beta fold hydrolase [Actinomycetota bacterium]